MISRRNYFAIAAIMLVVLFMFQFTNVTLEMWNDYERNENAVDVSSLTARSGVFTPEAKPLMGYRTNNRTRLLIVNPEHRYKSLHQ